MTERYTKEIPDLVIPIDGATTLKQMERRYIDTILQYTNNNKAHAAEVLGIDRRTLYRKLSDIRVL